MRHEQPLHAHWTLAGIAQQVTAPKEGFCARFVEHDLRVHRIGNLEAYLEGQIRFDEPSYDGSIGPLRGRH